MRFVRGFEGFCGSVSSGTVVAMGNFDGVHLGHAQILSNVVNSARASGLKSCFLSFHPHPLRVVAPERAPGMLQTIEEKLISLSAYEPDFVLVVPFSWEFSQTPAPDFVDKYLLGLLDCRELHVGADARFGRKREGDVSMLRRLSSGGMFRLSVTEDVQVGEHRVSSSRIRRSILDGDMADAVACLGRPWTIAGEVVHGAGRGRKMGFPTANIAADNSILPSAGVYSGFSRIDSRFLPVAVHIGPIPTFGVKNPVVEAHIDGFEGDLAGRRLRVHLVSRVRGIRCFDGTRELVAGISADVDAVRSQVLELLDNRASIAYKVARFDPEGGDCW
ncbi:MAG TPA: riboflavin biosynthesis protein RibF [Myxococcota bacterium]|nr:riboflavin biosynthesis protein RibF [Myxococcota bacterium]HOC98431.1 riboflavin biosynthesis protein RibF [Myxococcota bacterium]